MEHQAQYCAHWAEPKDDSLLSDASKALSDAEDYAFDIQHTDGHWCGEFATGAFPTAEHVFFCQACGIDIAREDASLFRKYILSLQEDDGSWAVAPGHPGDVSMSAEAYLALKLLGMDTESKQLQHARAYIRHNGGLAKVRVLTRIYLAQFGLFPWNAVPQVPAELMLLPVQSPINIYTLWVPARSTVVPLLILRHHEAVYALPNGRSSSNDYLDELWLDPSSKSVPYGQPFLKLLKDDLVSFAFQAIDYAVFALKSGLCRSPLRRLARKKTLQYLLEHQNPDGSWFGYLTAFQFAVQALLLEGFTLKDGRIQRALAAMELWMWEDESGKRIQLSNSPVWDTALMMKALCMTNRDHRSHERVRLAASWCKRNQLLSTSTDLHAYIPDMASGGFAFEYHNPWFPDVDDTAAVALAMLEQDPSALERYPFIRAAEFVLAMQNADGGWSAFDRDRNPEWLHKSPFNDMDNLCDASSADVTGRCLELCGNIIESRDRSPEGLVIDAQRAATCAVEFLRIRQEGDGSWWGRWGINYVFGTCNAIGGLALFSHADGSGRIKGMIRRGADFLVAVQHEDGGWGEGYATYDKPPSPPGSGPSMPSPTAWALLGLFAAGVMSDEPVVQRGVQWLSREQTNAGRRTGRSWYEKQHTGTGFPRKLYIGYKMYQHYFPMMALAKYRDLVRGRREPILN